MPSMLQLTGTVLFVIAVAHTFLTRYFEQLAHQRPKHAGVWHLLSEVEVIFGFWAIVLVGIMVLLVGSTEATHYLESLDYTEPAFVFVIMVIAASRPVLDLCRLLVRMLTQLVPVDNGIACYFICLSLLPLLGSLVTEPAAMTLTALLLRDNYYVRDVSSRFKYLTLGTLFVNVSIGGTLTNFAAPPVLMVAGKWNWDSLYMLSHFGWKGFIAIFINTLLVTLLFRRELKRLGIRAAKGRAPVPWSLIILHVLFLCGVVYFAHHSVVFIGLFLLFLGFADAYKQYQDRLMLREGLLVGFFLAGLVTLGNMQQWWLQDLLAGMHPTVLFFGATLLTAVTDNAALTYLGSLVENTNDAFRYALLAGAVTGGGLTVIANAPNPAGFAILQSHFDQGVINPLKLLGTALLPTCVAGLAFLLL